MSGKKSSLKFDWERALGATRYRKDVKHIGRAVAGHAASDGSRAHPGVDALMGETSMSRRAVLYALAALTRDGWWTIGPRAGRERGRNNEYQLIVPTWINDLLPGRPDGKDEYEHQLFLAAKRDKYAAAKQIASTLLSNAVALATTLAAVDDEDELGDLETHGGLPEGSGKGIGTPSPEPRPCANSHPDHVQTIAGPCANSTPVSAGQEPLTTLENNPLKEQASGCAVDADASTLRDDADASPSDTDDHSSASGKAPARRPARRKRPLSIALVAVERAGLGSGELDDLLAALAEDVNGAAYRWALKHVCEEKKRVVVTTHYLLPDMLWPRVVAWGLMWARNQPMVPESLADALDGFSWAPETYDGERQRKESAGREELPRVIYYASSNGDSDEAVHETFYARVDRLSDDELAAKVEHLRRYRKRIWSDSLASAQEQYEGKGMSDREVTVLALKYAIKHYEGKWPMFVVPTHVPDAA